jgi:uncharacterized surface protein with fasciclin (FAS1) repeats
MFRQIPDSRSNKTTQKEKMKYQFATLTMLGLFGGMIATTACAANRNVESMLAEEGDLSMFSQALHNTGVANELNDNREYTVFAPTNAAFAEIQPRDYPCFYSTQCRTELAAVLRNHIVPRNETIHALSLWGGNPIPTIGTRGLYVEETYKNQYTVEGRNVLTQGGGEHISVYRIDGVIANDRELSRFSMAPVADNDGAVTEKTVTTTYRTPVTYPAVSGENLIPGGYSGAPIVYVTPGAATAGDTTQTTTVTRTTTTDSSE